MSHTATRRIAIVGRRGEDVQTVGRIAILERPACGPPDGRGLHGTTVAGAARMMERGALGLVCVLVLGCGRVIVEDDRVDASSAGPGGSTGAGEAPSSGGGPSEGGGDASVGSGGVGASGGAGGSGAEACASLVWSDVDAQDLGDVAGELVAIGDGTLEPVPILFGHRDGASQTPLRVVLDEAESAWAGVPRLTRHELELVEYWPAFADGGNVQVAPTRDVVGYDDQLEPGWLIAINKPAFETSVRPYPARMSWHHWHIDAAKHGDANDTEAPLVRAVAYVDGPSAHVWATGQEELALRMTNHSDDGRSAELTGVACADRRIAVTALAVDGRVAVAHAASGGSCTGARATPDTAELVFLDPLANLENPELVRGEPVPMGAPITELHLARGGDALWLAGRVEGAQEMQIARLSLDGELEARASIPLRRDREVALAAGDDRLVVVDAGLDEQDLSRLRARVLDAGGALVLSSEPLGSSDREVTHVAAGASPDGEAVLVGFLDRAPSGVTRRGVVRAGCGTSP